MAECANIVNTLRATYEGPAWHGAAVKEVLSKIPPDKLHAKIGDGHTIIELILHMAAWRTYAIEKLNGNETYEVSEAANFPIGKNLDDAMEVLNKTQSELITAITGFDEQKLHEQVPSKKYSYYKMLHGVVHHDLYHLGQIVMITKQF